MDWEKLAFMLSQEAQKTINDAMKNENKTIQSVSAALTAEMVLSGLAKCIYLARNEDGHPQ